MIFAALVEVKDNLRPTNRGPSTMGECKRIL